MSAKRVLGEIDENIQNTPPKKIKDDLVKNPTPECLEHMIDVDKENESASIKTSTATATSSLSDNQNISNSPHKDCAKQVPTLENPWIKVPLKLTAEQEEKAKLQPNFQIVFNKLKMTSLSGDFAVQGEAHELPVMLGLEVNGFGRVGLPFCDPQASELIKMCKQAEKIDHDVLSPVQLDASQVRIKNHHEWESKLKEFLKRVGKSLGCQHEIEVN